MNSPRGKMVIAAVLGFGLATFFRKACRDKNCLTFEAPDFSMVEDATWKVGKKCYAFKSSPAECVKSRRTVNFA